MMKKICTVSGKEFEITQKDLDFYDKMGVPTPTLCPEERMRRRLAFRNERSLYHITCDKSGKKIISMYSPDKKFPVFDNDIWWSDVWDGKDFGRNFDFDTSFFEQFQKLLNIVPKMARIQQGENKNSKFTNCASWNKNCYLLFSSNRCEDCAYGTFCLDSKDCLDCTVGARNELCYEGINLGDCYECIYSTVLENCSNCSFCRDCVGCKNCFGCVNLRNKQYYFLNQKCTKDEYLKKIKNLELNKYSKLKDMRSHFRTFEKKQVYKYMESLQVENCSGNVVYFSKNAENCFDVEYLEDCKFCNDVTRVKSSYDISFYGCSETNELLYECEAVGHGVFNVRFSKLIWGGCSEIDYSYECFASKNLFGCTGLRNAEYCIFNKQYSKEEYFILKAKIIEHMKASGEWGEFFPMEISPFGYNETVAQEYFPLDVPSKKQTPPKSPSLRGTAENSYIKGELKYNWKLEETSAQYSGPKIEIPDDISDINEDICEKILTCESTGKNYRIVKPELKFYKKMNLPIPRICPDERHKRRMALRNPRKLWERKCDNPRCKDKLQFVSTFSPDRPEKVYCEKCYLGVVD